LDAGRADRPGTQDLQQLGRKDGDVDRHLKEMRQVIKNIPTQPTKARDKLIYHRMKQEPWLYSEKRIVSSTSISNNFTLMGSNSH
jgi:hypothetical protein